MQNKLGSGQDIAACPREKSMGSFLQITALEAHMNKVRWIAFVAAGFCMTGLPNSASAEKLPKATPADFSAAMLANLRCLNQRAEIHDDGVSDAATIAPIIARACQQTWDAYVQVIGRHLKPRVRKIFVELQADDQLEMAIWLLLTRRTGNLSDEVRRPF